MYHSLLLPSKYCELPANPFLHGRCHRTPQPAGTTLPTACHWRTPPQTPPNPYRAFLLHPPRNPNSSAAAKEEASEAAAAEKETGQTKGGQLALKEEEDAKARLPELQAPLEIFYNDIEARKYTTSSRIIGVQNKISERALKLLALPDDGVPRLLLDIGCGYGLSGETNTISYSGHHWIGLDISQAMLMDGDLISFRHRSGIKKRYPPVRKKGLGFQPGVVDGAISISADQLLCYADKSSHKARLRLNSKARKAYIVLTCGPPSLTTALPKVKVNMESCLESDDEERQTVCVLDRNRPSKRLKTTKKGKGKEWVFKNKGPGKDVPHESQYTARKRKAYF